MHVLIIWVKIGLEVIPKKEEGQNLPLFPIFI
jgi:hypothetical protein